MAADEVRTLTRLKTYRDALGSTIRLHGGRVVDAVSDNLLGEFPSVVDAIAVLPFQNLSSDPEQESSPTGSSKT